MPPVLRDCVLVSIPKGVKDTCTSSSLKYLPIALLSKVLKRLILLKFIGFKPTTLRTGVLKNVISQ